MRILPAFSVLLLPLLLSAGAEAQVNTPAPEPAQDIGAPTAVSTGQVGFRIPRYGLRRQLGRSPVSALSGPAQRSRSSKGSAGARTTIGRCGRSARPTSAIAISSTPAEYNRFGKVRASFDFNQIPLFFSEVTRTAYTTTSPGVLGLGSLPSQVQSGAATTAIYDANATPFDLRLKRTIADFRMVYSATEHLDFSASFKNTDKNGEQPWAGTFGFSDAVELAVPVDTRTSEVGVAAEWIGSRGQARVGYDGSFFSNDVSTLVWANPLRSADSPTAGPAQGRMALWPDSNLNSGSLSGSMRFGRAGQATAYLSLGSLSQNDALIPFTINAQLASPPLDRTTADASAQIVATSFSYTTRATSTVWLSTRFRSYDFDNNTPVFNVGQTVNYDTSLATLNHGTSPFSFNRKLFDVDTSWSPSSAAAFRAGYTYEGVEQSFRTFDTTHDNRLKLSADALGIRLFTLRAQYQVLAPHRHRPRRTIARRHRRADVAAAVRSVQPRPAPFLDHRHRASEGGLAQRFGVRRARHQARQRVRSADQRLQRLLAGRRLRAQYGRVARCVV